MKRWIIGILFLVFLGCKSTQTNKVTDQPNPSMKTDTDHNSMNSVDWDGIYRGVLPCADCEGIKTTIYLNKDLSYKNITQYLGKPDSAYEASGKFTWNEKGNTITLLNGDQTKAKKYLVGEGTLTQLDLQGNRITGEQATKYILSKSNYAILEKYWKLVELNGKPVAVDSMFIKEPHIIFRDNDNRMFGHGGCNNISAVFAVESINRITISKAISTQMACPRMELEQEFLDVLQRVDNFNVNGDNLMLNKARMAPLARFKAVYMK